MDVSAAFIVLESRIIRRRQQRPTGTRCAGGPDSRRAFDGLMISSFQAETFSRFKEETGRIVHYASSVSQGLVKQLQNFCFLLKQRCSVLCVCVFGVLKAFFFVFVSTGRCEAKGALTGSNAGITSIEFDSAVSQGPFTPKTLKDSFTSALNFPDTVFSAL